MNFFVLGDEDVILGFKFIGIQGKIADANDDAFREFKNATTGVYGDVGVLLVTEKVSSMIEEELMEWQISGKYPLIVELPDLEGHMPGKKTMLESIREAVGLHV